MRTKGTHTIGNKFFEDCKIYDIIEYSEFSHIFNISIEISRSNLNKDNQRQLGYYKKIESNTFRE